MAEQIFNNTLSSSTRCGNGNAYCVDEFDLFPPIPHLDNRLPVVVLADRLALFGGSFRDLTVCNYLRTTDSETGKLKWRSEPIVWGADVENSGSFFLGPPIVIDDFIYILNEKNKSLRLLTFNSKSLVGHEPLAKYIKFEVAMTSAPESAGTDFTRRIHALHVVATDKLFLCPTHLGALVAVDRKTNKVAWTARYADEKAKRFENFSSTWRMTPALVAGKLVLYAPPDDEAIYAIDLVDGSIAWKREPRQGCLPGRAA